MRAGIPTVTSILRGASIFFMVATLSVAVSVSSRACSRGKLRVAIDIGHSRFDPGATSAKGKSEFSYNSRFARELVDRGREKPRLQLFLLNLNGEPTTLTQRTAQAAMRKADVFVSIHHDSVNDKYLKPWTFANRPNFFTTAFEGFSVFVSSSNRRYDASLMLATAIARNFKALDLRQTLHHAEPIAGENRKLLSWELGVYDAPFAVLRTAASPAVLLELGVISNRQEETLLETPDHRQKMTVAILDALDRYCQ